MLIEEEHGIEEIAIVDIKCPNPKCGANLQVSFFPHERVVDEGSIYRKIQRCATCDVDIEIFHNNKNNRTLAKLPGQSKIL